jgi:hypothetical protein
MDEQQAPPVVPGTIEWLSAACLAGAAALHLVAAGSHAGSTVDVTVFTLTAWSQLALAAWLVLRPSRAVLAVAAVASAAVVAGWVASRTNGLPWGVHRGNPEAVGGADLLATSLQAIVVLLAVLPGTIAVPARWRRALALAAVLAVGGLATAATAAVPAPHSHDDAAHDDAAHDDAAHDDAAHDGHASAACTDAVTDDQRAAADVLVADTRAAVEPFMALDVARAAGYVPITPEAAQIVHYANPAYLGDGVTLETDRVESLVYGFGKDRTPYFLGAMYLLDDPGAEPPMPGGCLTTWHAHDNLCVAPGRGMVAAVGADGSCPDGSSNRLTPMMLHVWSLELPTGPFSELHELQPTDVVSALVARG